MLQFDLKVLSLKASKNGKPSLVDICHFMTLPTAKSNSSGSLSKDEIVSDIMDKLIEELPDTSAAAVRDQHGYP